MESKNISIRKFKSIDSSKLCEIIKRNLIEINSKDYPKEIIDGMCSRFVPENMIENAKKRDIYVAELNGELIGTASLENNIIYGVFVDVNYHGCGVGKKLMSIIEDNAKENSVNLVQVPSSITSQNFYYKLGYNYVKEVETPDSGRCIIVEKTL
ncbi:GNAT family acetyltransferase [Clostridium gelidum]|uniref:GNAT family acetyltransferase n=1 Tax=Clostridium gelidum TaxID=704125 RepID=A0ABN6J2Z9_9CLOT|nr:GNAT family N-acetyltransferase [Clostridium gelidum]BCZ48709.1 GNAT family acetyltransferase [Clostridium gelidum]